MLQVQHLRKHYGAATVLADITFLVNDGEHLALIGPNGAGKSTILRCIVGDEQPDAGSITFAPPDLTLGYLPQALSALADQTVGAVIDQAQAAWIDAEAAVQRAADALADGDDFDGAMMRYEQALAQFEALGGYEREHRTATVLDGLGLATIERATLVSTLSGGQKTRLGLATLLLREPDLLLLDEPTNHLDVEALEWLETWVQSYPRAVLVVSHDRAFLDRTVTRILALDADTRTIRSYSGNYSQYVQTREHEHERHVEIYKRQQEYVERVASDIARLKGEALKIELTTTSAQPSIRKFAKKKAQLAKSRERKLERFLESDERVEKPKNHWSVKLDFGPTPPSGRAVLRIENVGFTYGATRTDDGRQIADDGRQTADSATIDSPPLLLHDVSFDVFYSERIAIVGPNGAGKSTLLKLIGGQLEPQHGSIRIGSNVRPGMLAQEHETLDPDRTILETALNERPMSETEARSFLHFFLFGGDSVYRRVRECSLGERSRLQLALLVLRGCNLLLLDEPLNHLDIEGREHFEDALDAFEGTIIAVAHDRAFLHNFAERVIEVRDGTIHDFGGGYDAYLRGTQQQKNTLI